MEKEKKIGRNVGGWRTFECSECHATLAGGDELGCGVYDKDFEEVDVRFCPLCGIKIKE